MDNRLSVYSSQRTQVIDIINKENEYFVERKYIDRKYGQVAPVFLEVHKWFTEEGSKIVEKPDRAESAIWVFKDIKLVDSSTVGNKLLKLNIPRDEILLFDMYEFNSILNSNFLSEDENEINEYNEKLKAYGVKQKSDIVLTNFYPQLKEELFNSWKSLFRNSDKLIENSGDTVIQGGIWAIKKEWIME